ncbi:MAG: NAD(P)-dependent oxidoreductase [Bacteroidota bacterium]
MNAKNPQTVLVTGAAGYIGSVLCRQLLAAGYRVRGLDSLLFGGVSIVDLMSLDEFAFVKADIRDAAAVAKALEGVDAVVHLAAIVGDPACKKFPREASEVMNEGTKALHQASIKAGVGHFVFASTCSNYGISDGNSLISEDTPLNPQSHYARLKVGFEEYLMEQSKGEMSWTVLRFATVYGYSPRLRFDLTVNHFTRDMSLGEELLVFDENLWRPYCHVEDLAASVGLVLNAGAEKMDGQVFNVGDSEENYTKKTIVGEILKVAPDAVVKYGDRGGDVRNYRVDFSRIASTLGFQITKRVPDGVRELNKLVTSGLLADPFDSTYKNC